MSWLRIQIWLLKYRILLALCTLLLAVLAWDIATTENKLYIQTTQTEDDFVIVCEWHSGFLNLHGGDKRVSHRVLVGKSNTELDCGWSLYGDFSVLIMHPLYRQMRGYDNAISSETPNLRYQNGKMVFTPVPFDQILDSVQYKYEGEELVDVVKAITSGHISLKYFKNYVEVREPDIKQFESLYGQKFVEYWQNANRIIDSENNWVDPAKASESFWKRTEKFLKNYHE